MLNYSAIQLYGGKLKYCSFTITICLMLWLCLSCTAKKEIKSTQGDALVEIVKKLEKETGNKAEKKTSGLIFLNITEGTGKQPAGPTAKVLAHYEGRLTNGDVFDSSFNRGQPLEFGLDGVIKGWTEGLQLMKEGGSAYLIIPPDLGYGQRGVGGVIPANSDLIFKVELIKTY